MLTRTSWSTSRTMSCKCRIRLRRVLQKCLCLYVYKLKVVQANVPENRVSYKKFALEIGQRQRIHAENCVF